MIKLRKGIQPAVLTENAATWTATLLRLLAAVPKDRRAIARAKAKYNHPRIKEALVKETHGKCAYCESYFRHVTYGDIEHRVAKTPRPDGTFDWDNLTIACDVCNTK
jgi:5-methylcytosine-specific restriction endonuclease McrA